METAPGEVMYFRRMGPEKPKEYPVWVLVFFGVFFTGAGQALQRRWWRAATYFISAVICGLLIIFVSQFFFFPQAIIWALSLVDAATWKREDEPWPDYS